MEAEKRIVKEDEIKVAIQYFNMLTGKRFGNGATNTKLMSSALELAELAEVRKAMKTWMAESPVINDNALNNFVCEFVDSKMLEQKVNETKDAVSQKETTVAESIDFLGKVVVDCIAKTSLDEIKDSVSQRLHEDCINFIRDTYGPLQRKIELEVKERKVEFKGVLHSKFETVLKMVDRDIPVFLTGPAGSGKNVICKQVAEALGLKFYFSNAVTQEYKITGFTDAMGKFQESQFYQAFKNGGLFMLDEMDASIPEVLVILNAAIANRYFDFPAPIGYVEAHPDFRVIAAGNTFGEGADSSYVGRNQLDAASLNRFATVNIDYDPRIEENCACGDEELLNFCRAFRNASKRSGINTVVSYRNIQMLAQTVSLIGAEDALRACLIKALDKDDLQIMRDSVQGCGQYTKAYEAILRSM